ncbi:MAG: T9SS type A sorting domain-containing protein, partial [Bacteroidales bacterium]|nr:T9SS type A sorting domain-containing protein [Bacteroidales bacterium]
DLHKGNSEVTRAYLSYGILDSTEITEIDIADNGFVEVTLEDLEPNTFYSFNINMEFDDGVILTSEPHYFETLDNTGISEIQNSNIQIYPNPTSDFIFIENIGTQPVSIYSLDGRLVKTVEAANVIDVRDLEEGMYLINIDGTTTKLVINK